jgi:hypothetical protein
VAELDAAGISYEEAIEWHEAGPDDGTLDEVLRLRAEHGSHDGWRLASSGWGDAGCTSMAEAREWEDVYSMDQASVKEFKAAGMSTDDMGVYSYVFDATPMSSEDWSARNIDPEELAANRKKLVALHTAAGSGKDFQEFHDGFVDARDAGKSKAIKEGNQNYVTPQMTERDLDTWSAATVAFAPVGRDKGLNSKGAGQLAHRYLEAAADQTEIDSDAVGSLAPHARAGTDPAVASDWIRTDFDQDVAAKLGAGGYVPSTRHLVYGYDECSGSGKPAPWGPEPGEYRQIMDRQPDITAHALVQEAAGQTSLF